MVSSSARNDAVLVIDVHRTRGRWGWSVVVSVVTGSSNRLPVEVDTPLRHVPAGILKVRLQDYSLMSRDRLAFNKVSVCAVPVQLIGSMGDLRSACGNYCEGSCCDYKKCKHTKQLTHFLSPRHSNQIGAQDANSSLLSLDSSNLHMPALQSVARRDRVYVVFELGFFPAKRLCTGKV